MVIPCFSSRSVLDLGTLILIYVMLGLGLNIQVGLAGLLDLGYVGFYAIGAYRITEPILWPLFLGSVATGWWYVGAVWFCAGLPCAAFAR